PGCTKFETSQNTRPHPQGQAQPGNSTNLIKNWYQQTWHTIEFSNNRHIRILLEADLQFNL
ncbi:hypothetical protein ACIP9X_09625, partial [Arthrobacter sp. NPDC093125]|uniref:hypothetical protein n=1 Tax=Arthrobacter sp. NPDC093125 TaxID=3363944 RepID=UPI003819D7D1